MTSFSLPFPIGEPRLAGRRALILGAGSVGPGLGIGKAIALLFGHHGARLCCVDRNENALDETLQLLREAGCDAVGATGDVTDEAALKAIVARCDAELGQPDILVNNVGASLAGGVDKISLTQWDQQFALNVHYAFAAMQLVLPGMVDRGGGTIVNISSIAALRHLGSDAVAYASSKAALLQLSRQVAVQYAPHAIRSNCVIPGLMNTPLVKQRLATRSDVPDVAAFIAERDARVPIGSMGDGWDIAYAVLYLASDESRYVTGAEILVDGALTATMR
jgi:NAD(P)-dependent dehydrogenase (short-subunit alcohol dehydrogenase family)